MGGSLLPLTNEEMIMIKSTFLAAAFVIAIIQPAFAEDTMMMKCDEGSMMKVQSDMDAMKDPAMKEQKDMAMKEMDMAKEAMKANKTDDCMMHMQGAMKAMKKS